jgi:hypothetical protein
MTTTEITEATEITGRGRDWDAWARALQVTVASADGRAGVEAGLELALDLVQQELEVSNTCIRKYPDTRQFHRAQSDVLGVLAARLGRQIAQASKWQ